MATNAERQRAWKARQAEKGLTQVNGWVHPSQAAKLALLIKALEANPDLEPGPAVHAITRRFVKYD